MISDNHISHRSCAKKNLVRKKLGKKQVNSFMSILPPLPLFMLQPLLNHIVTFVAKKHPELFLRLGKSANKTFKINPTNLPFFLILQPNPLSPTLKAYNQCEIIEHDTYIEGSFATLMAMIDAQSDSDALFFNREIIVTGDSEAMVALRNALDDIDGSLAQDVANSFGLLSKPARSLMQSLSKERHE